MRLLLHLTTNAQFLRDGLKKKKKSTKESDNPAKYWKVKGRLRRNCLLPNFIKVIY